ncbi:MAG: CIA30 family protein [Planctomycetaceae bacterium]|nr:CIA30 family protein [Planctomycetaceae bacterium]
MEAGCLEFRLTVARRSNHIGMELMTIRISIFAASLFLGLCGQLINAEEPIRYLYKFDRADNAQDWKTVNDGVMGGISDGKFKITQDGALDFYGKLSLENNGGFASVRTRKANLNFQDGDILVARVRGDGRQYAWNLYVPTWRIAFAWRSFFNTKKDEWVEIRTPLAAFRATSFGREMKNRKLDPAKINGLGIILADKQAGPFDLEIDWIGIERTE